MPVSFLSPAQRDSYGQYLGDPSTQELARYFHLDDSDHTQIVEKRGDANRLGFALQLTTVRFVGTFLDDPTAVPPAVLATMSRQLGIDTTTDLTGYRDGKWRFAHAAQIRTEHGYRDLADRAAGFGLTRWLYAQCWTGTERPSALFDRATTWMLAHKVLLPGATTLERFVAKLRHRVDVRVWRVLASGISPPQQRRLEDLLRVPDEGRSSSLVTLRTGAAMVSGPALVRAHPQRAHQSRPDPASGDWHESGTGTGAGAANAGERRARCPLGRSGCWPSRRAGPCICAAACDSRRLSLPP